MAVMMGRQRKIGKSIQGFTLVELIVVITLTGILATVVATVINNQMYGYVQLQQRAQLVQMVDAALQEIAQDIHGAVPNSVRISGNFIEMVPVVMVAPYRAQSSGTGTSDSLDFTKPDNTFDVLDDLVSADTYYSDAQVVIYNVGLTSGGVPVLGSNLYASNPLAQPNVISSSGVTLQDNGSEDRIQLDVAQQFSRQSPDHRMYLVRGALSYGCDPASGTLTRYQRYAIQQSQPTDGAAPPLSAAGQALLANKVSACVFRYTAGTFARNAVVSIQLILADGNQSITLMKQVQISNEP